MSCRCVTSAVSLTISGIKPGFALLLERVASALTQGLPSGSLIMADRSFSLPLAFHGVIVRVRTGSSPSPVGGEQLRPQCCHCGRYSLYGFRGRCRRRPFLGLNHCWPLTDTAAFSAAYYYAAQANISLPALPLEAALSFPPREIRPCTLYNPSRLSRSRLSFA